MSWLSRVLGQRDPVTPHRTGSDAQFPRGTDLPSEAEWLAQAARDTETGLLYDKSELRTGARPHRGWHEYPLVSVWVSATRGAFASERTVTVCATDAPVINSAPQPSVAAALLHAAAAIETAATRTDEDRKSPRLAKLLPDGESTLRWRRIAEALRERAARGDLDALQL